jgi:hypothetical protein
MNPNQIVWTALLLLGGLPFSVRAAGELPPTNPGAGLGQPIAERALDGVRGREGTITPLSSQVSQSSLSASISSNSLSSASTGDNLAGNSAFGGASGIATMIQNSGNQVVIQNNVTINLSVK